MVTSSHFEIETWAVLNDSLLIMVAIIVLGTIAIMILVYFLQLKMTH